MFRLVFLYFAVVSAELEMVQVLLRHGDRAPSFTYPADEQFNVDQYFPRGFSQLTQNGFEQANELGSFLRSKYSKLVEKYDRKRVLIRSSDKDRCIETAMGLAAKLFPDEMAVPVHTYSHYKQDLLLKPNSVKCRMVDRIVKNDKKKHNELIDSHHSGLFAFLTQKTGWKVSGSNIDDVYNVLYRKYANNIPQPDWVYSPVPGQSDNTSVLDHVVELKRQSRMLSFNSDQKSRLRTGYLLGQMMRDMSAADHRRSMIVYSSHDATLTSLMYSLGVANHQLPPYTSALMIELHRLDADRFVKISLRNSTTLPPYELTIPGCDTLCPLAQLEQLMAGRKVESREHFEELCQNDEETFSDEMIVPEEPSAIHQELPSILAVGVVSSMLDLVTVLKTKE